MADIKRLKLRLETHPTTTPIPIVFHVFDGDTDLGIITLPEFERARQRLSECGEPLPQYMKE